jgi:hypothetical protein
MKPIGALTRTVVATVAAALLAACGGGGSQSPPTGSDGPPGEPPSANDPRLLAPETVELQAATTQAVAGKTVELSLQNLTESLPVYIGAAYSTTGIQSATASVNGSRVLITISFRRPVDLGPGTFTDTITVRACRETPCVNHIAGSPKSIAVRLIVAPPADPPTMTLQRTSVSVDGFVLDPGAPPTQTVDASFANTGSDYPTPNVFVSSTSSIVTQARFSQTSGAAGRISIELKDPASLGAGMHTGIVTVRSCFDAACVNELAGSPVSITVQYKVSDSVSGPAGYRARNIAVTANDIAWDAARQVLYVSIASSSTANANTIGVLDPVSGTFSSYAPVGNNPGRMEISPDGQFLYVALRGFTGGVQRLLLPSLALDLDIPLGAQPSSSIPLYAREFHVSPGSPRTIAVARTNLPTGGEGDLAVFDDAIMRTQTVGGSFAPLVSTFQWDTASRIFGVDSRTSDGAASQIAVSATGLQVTASQKNVTSSDNDAYLVNGRMYMERGRVFNPLTFAQVGFLPLAVGASTGGMAIDVAGNRLFLVSNAELKSFDLGSLAPIASMWLPRAWPNSGVTRAVRWGSNGLAILNYQDSSFGTKSLLLIDGAFVRP